MERRPRHARMTCSLLIAAAALAGAGADAQQTAADVSLSIHGPAIRYEVVGRNLAGVPAENLTLSFTPPETLFILNMDADPGARCEVIFTVPARLQCTWADSTPPGASRRLWVGPFSGSIPPTLVARARVYTGSSINPFGPAAATAVLTTTYADAADLALTLTPPAGNPTLGVPAELSLSAINQGGGYAIDMELRVETSDRVKWLLADAAGADCVATTSVSCVWPGETAPGTRRSLRLRYLPQATEIQFRARAGSAIPDLEHSNNERELRLAVNPAPVPTLNLPGAVVLVMMLLASLGLRRRFQQPLA